VKQVFVDANVFLRFFTEDDANHCRRAKQLFERAEAGEVELITGPPVLFEVVWTLDRSYRLPHGRIVDVLKAIRAQTGLTLVDASTVSAAIDLSETTGVGFADAYIAASADLHACDGTATFNVRDFTRLNAPIAEF